jgi:DDB1- and CUL4-associated factor 1
VLSSYTLDNVVELASAAFVFKAVLDLFDAQDELQKLFVIPNSCVSGSGGNSGGLGSSNVN